MYIYMIIDIIYMYTQRSSQDVDHYFAFLQNVCVCVQGHLFWDSTGVGDVGRPGLPAMSCKDLI